MLRKSIQVGAVILLLMTGGAFAQLPKPALHLGGDNKPPQTKEQKEYEKELDDAYKSAVKKIPAPEKKSADPWADMRPTTSTTAKNKQQ